MEVKKLTLNKKRTFIIGLAFFGILMLWQVYNNYCPIILEYLLKGKVPDDRMLYIIGAIMALDNLVALVGMPIMGILSDKTKTPIGRRMPYIIVGTIAGALIFPFIALAFIWNSLAGVIIAMGLFLIVMQAYRNPAVSLMADVTPKPLRSLANSIINLVGYVGGIIAAVLGMIFVIKKDAVTGELPAASEIGTTVLLPFIISAVAILIILIVLIFNFNETKVVNEVKEEMELGELASKSLEDVKSTKKLSKKDIVNLIILLGSIFLWFMAFNAIETFNSLFAEKILGNSGIASTSVIILTLSSIVSFVLFAKLSDKVGRWFVVVIGLVLLIFGISVVTIATFVLIPDPNNISVTSENLMPIIMYVCILFIGVGWAMININSFPMVVELANKENVGKFTGYYYAASMLAQTITPILVGLVMDFTEGLRILYLYSALFTVGALVVFLFVKERNTSNEEKDVSVEEIEGGSI
ncbi:MAG: MFS transporter [Bacillales bacterium]|jgi:MFS family permease|nr:MFS transporter [Bacillales bacterium]